MSTEPKATDDEFHRLLRDGAAISYTNGFMAATLRLGELALEHPVASVSQLIHMLAAEAEKQPGHYSQRKPK